MSKNLLTFEDEADKLIGQILTIIDTALPSGTQNKATKDLARTAILRFVDHVQSRSLLE
jgi:hypothetical protein